MHTGVRTGILDLFYPNETAVSYRIRIQFKTAVTILIKNVISIYTGKLSSSRMNPNTSRGRSGPEDFIAPDNR